MRIDTLDDLACLHAGEPLDALGDRRALLEGHLVNVYPGQRFARIDLVIDAVQSGGDVDRTEEIRVDRGGNAAIFEPGVVRRPEELGPVIIPKTGEGRGPGVA